MRARVIFLRIVVALVTFLLGVSAAVLIGHINPFERASRRHCNVEYRLVAPYSNEYHERFHYSCPHMQTDELRSNTRIVVVPQGDDPIVQQQELPLEPPPPPPPAPRLSHRR